MLNVKNSKAYMIRDTVNDIEMDNNTKINTIEVTWGYNAKEELNLASADYIIDDPSELVRIFRGL